MRVFENEKSQIECRIISANQDHKARSLTNTRIFYSQSID
jgi:hypothetical protein